MIMANKTADYEFTIVVPVYNEEDNMERLEKTLAGYLPKAARKACVLFVNDGSKDMSLEGIKAACERNHDFYYISFVKNCGLSAAIKAGFDYCESKLVGYVDADLQTAPEKGESKRLVLQEYAVENRQRFPEDDDARWRNRHRMPVESLARRCGETHSNVQGDAPIPACVGAAARRRLIRAGSGEAFPPHGRKI